VKRSGVQASLLAGGIVSLVSGFMLSGRAAQADEFSSLVLSLAMLVIAAKIGGDLAGRFGQPAVLGELAAGVLLGNLPGFEPLQYLASDGYLDMFARLGMLLLLFEVGLELSVRDLFAVGASSLLVAVCGTTVSFALGWSVAAQMLPGAPGSVHIFLAAAITATSVGITARVLKDLRASRSGEAKIILGAAVVDDILALVVLGLVTGGLAGGAAARASEWRPAVALVAKTIGFLTLAIVLGVKLTPQWFRQAARLRAPGALLALGLCFCFVLSWAANAIGLAPLVGAFAAGLILENSHSEAFVQRGERPLGELLEPLTSFLVPIFFVLVGFRTNVRVLADPAVLGLSLALTVAAVLGKLACGVGVLSPGIRKLTVGLGMVPRGEVTLVFAALGRTLQVNGAPLLDDRGYAALITLVIITTLITPPALKWSWRSDGSDGDLRRVSGQEA
jgi:Kef-type K+ transport system membrane component KefB